MSHEAPRTWAKARLPEARAFKTAPVGTAYSTLFQSQSLAEAGHSVQLHVYVKVAADTWLHTTTSEDADPVAELQRCLREPGRRKRYLSFSDREMRAALHDSMRQWDGRREGPHEELLEATVTVSCGKLLA